MKIITFLFGISVFGTIIPISVSQDEILEGKIICHPLICPESTYKCVVSERSVTSHHNIFKWSRCLDKNGQILLQDKRFIPSTFPGAPIDTLLEVVGSSLDTQAKPINEVIRRIYEMKRSNTKDD